MSESLSCSWSGVFPAATTQFDPALQVDLPAIRAAAQLSGHATLSFWDALIVAAALRIGAKVLYSEDLNPGQDIGGVRVTNPFRS